jgi:hypothetical protein
MGELLFAALLVGLQEERFPDPIDVSPRPIASDPTVKYDYDIVYVRARRLGDEVHKRFYTDIASPVYLEPGADLMLLHPDGTEELLVAGGEEGAVTDPAVSFDGEWVFYTYIHSLKGAGQFSAPRNGADIYKIHVKSRKIVRLTEQEFTPNTGAADWSRNRLPYGVLNFGPFPLPGGRLAFTSNRNAFRPPRGYPPIALQLFVMDDDGKNLEQIGFLNVAGALHPVTLADGRIIFSSLESQGIRGEILWGIWEIRPDGTGWGPVVSAFDPGGAPNAYHFQSQLSDGSVIVEGYYNQNNSGFGTYVKLPPQATGFGPGYMQDPRNKPWRFGRHDNGKPRWYRMPFMPEGSIALTPFAHIHDGPADPSILGDKSSPKVGKVTHPSGAPDNHLLTIWSPGPTNHQYTYLPQLDGGIYLMKNGAVVTQPGQMLLIKNDPKYNESWPRALVPYKRIYGIDEPKRLAPLANDGSRSPHLPAGTPFGLVGTSSLYKRESYPNGVVPPGKVTAAYAGGKDPWKGLDAFTSHGNGMPLNWHNQGADAGLYDNADIHAIRILVMEPTTALSGGRRFYSHARERLRILGEIPVRKFDGEKQPLDPDGNPDTSFLARIPADTAFTFQTIDKDGMLLNMSQTWHQLRPGEIRTNCGGCHAHSQKPTHFETTLAARPDYSLFDLGKTTPMVTSKARDASGKKWDADDRTGLRMEKAPVNVEYFRDVKPILERSCVACHTKTALKPPAGLVLDADDEIVPYEHHGKFPGTYYRLALDGKARFGHKPVGYDSWGYPQASRYVRMFQSRRSLLVWKLFGKRLDGFSNDDHPSESEPGSGKLVHRGAEVLLDKNRARLDIDFVGKEMPPPESEGKIELLTDEDRRAIVRWIDLGCPIDLDFDAKEPAKRGYGWMADDNRPILTLASPTQETVGPISKIVVGMWDYYTGLDLESFRCEVDGRDVTAGFQETALGVRECRLDAPVSPQRIVVSVKDRAGNVSRIDREFRRARDNPSR